MPATSSSIMAAAAAAEVAAHHHHQQQQHQQHQQQAQQQAQASAQAQHPISVSQLQQLQVYPSAQGAYQLQQLYQHAPQMFLPGNLTFQNPYQASAAGISLQLPNTNPPKSQSSLLPKSVQNQTLSHMKPTLTNASGGRSNNSGQMIKSATIVPQNAQQYAQNNQQTVVISQLPSILPQPTSQAAQSAAIANSKLIDAQKAKHFMLQQNGNAIQPKPQLMPNVSMASHPIVHQQFKQQLASSNQTHLITAATQSPMLNQAQLLGSLQQLPHGLAWTTGPAQPALIPTPNSQIFIRSGQPASDGQQQLFIQSSTQPIQTMGNTPIYVHPNSAGMHLMPAGASAQPNLTELHPPMISTSVAPTSMMSSTSTSHSSAGQNSIGIMSKGNRNRLSSSSSLTGSGQQSHLINENGKLSHQRLRLGIMSNSGSSTPSSQIPNRPGSVGSQQSGRDGSLSSSLNQSLSQTSGHQKVLTQKSTQQMNAELLATKSNNGFVKMKNLIRSDSSRSLNSQGSEESKSLKSNGESGKKLKDESKQLNGKKSERRDLSSENIESISGKSNGNLKKSEKKKFGLNKMSNKSQVLTHCIDGHIILESSVPFAVLPNLSHTLRERSNGINNHQLADDRRLSDAHESAALKLNSHAEQMEVASGVSLPPSATPKEIRIKNKKLKKAKLKAANQAAMLAKASASNGQVSEDKSNLTLTSPAAIVPIPGTLIPYNPTVAAQTIAIPKPNSLGPSIAQMAGPLANPALSVCNGTNISHSSTMINGMLVNNDSVMDLDESSFMHKQKIASTPIKESLVSLPNESINSVSAAPAGGPDETDKPVHLWTVQDVYDYVTNVSSAEYAKVLIDHHIDGRALLLLTVPILKDELKLKLGPVLILKAKIDELRENYAGLDNEANYLPAERNIYKWTVSDVYYFVMKLASKEYAEEFEKQEMDGHALTLLSQEHIMKDMQMQFGPGLKILSKIKELKERADNNS